jgi:hypothetical protein
MVFEENLNTLNKMNDIAIIIPSCDKYSDVWGLLMQSIEKFMCGDIPKIYLITNSINFKHPLVCSITIGDDISWSDNLSKALDKVDEEYVLMWIDDLILLNDFNWNDIQRKIQWFFEQKSDYMRLNPTPIGVDKTKSFSKIAVNDYYRSSTVFSIWRKEVLERILVSGESAWQFEIIGTDRTNKYKKWYASSSYLINYTNLVIKGKVHPKSLSLVQKAGLIYGSDRVIMSNHEYINQLFLEFRSKIFSMLPRKFRNVIRRRM